MSRKHDAHRKPHRIEPEMAGNQRGVRRHGCEIQRAEQHGKQQQQRIIVGHEEQHDEGKGTEEINRSQQRRPMHAVRQPARDDHAHHVEPGKQPDRPGTFGQRKPTQGGKGDQMDLDDARRRKTTDHIGAADQPENRLTHKIANLGANPAGCRRATGNILLHDGFALQKSERQQAKRHHHNTEDNHGRPPAQRYDRHGDKRQKQKLTAADTRGSNRNGKAPPLNELAGDRRGRDRHADDAIADRRTDTAAKEKLRAVKITATISQPAGFSLIVFINMEKPTWTGRSGDAQRGAWLSMASHP